MTLLLIGLVVLGTAFAVTVAATPVVRVAAESAGWIDLPDDGRKRHDRPVPSLGGIALALGMTGGMVALYVAASMFDTEVRLPRAIFWLGAAIMLFVGVYDDVRGVGFKRKFCAQLFVAYLLLFAGYRIDASVLPFVGADPYEQALVSIPLTLFWIIGVINAVNILDGLDGLAAGVILISIAFLATVFGMQGEGGLVLLAVVIGGALLGFLVYNFNPASIFMGDSGSLLLGYIVAVFALEGSGHVDPRIALLVPVVALGLPLLDTFVSMVRRARLRRSLFAPDSDHIHHRLMSRFNHRRAVLMLYLWALGFGLLALLMSILSPMQAMGVMLATAVLALLVVRWLGYHRVQPLNEAGRVSVYSEYGDGLPRNVGPPIEFGDGKLGLGAEPDLVPLRSDADRERRRSAGDGESREGVLYVAERPDAEHRVS